MPLPQDGTHTYSAARRKYGIFLSFPYPFAASAEVHTFGSALDRSGDNPAQVGGFLTDQGDLVFHRVIAFQYLRDTFVRNTLLILIFCQRKRSEFQRFFLLVNDHGREVLSPYPVHQVIRRLPQGFFLRFLQFLRLPLRIDPLLTQSSSAISGLNPVRDV